MASVNQVMILDDATDFILFYSEKDESEAKNFKEKVEKEANGVSGYMYSFTSMPPDLQTINEICSKGVQTWFFITDTFINDQQMQFVKDELLMRAILSQKKTFIPIWSKPKWEFQDLPFGLAALTGLDVTNTRCINKIIKMFIHTERGVSKKKRLVLNTTQKII